MEKKFNTLQRNWDILLAGLYALVILYTTLVPFRFAKDPAYISRKFHRIDWQLYLIYRGFYSGSDILINILLFIPLGIFLALLIRRRNSLQTIPGIVGRATLAGMCLSILVEFLQIFTYNRDPSISDVFNNTLGTFIGSAFALPIYTQYSHRFATWWRKIFQFPESFMVATTGALLLLFYLAPFDFTLNVKSVTRQWAFFLKNPLQLHWNGVAELLFLFAIYFVLDFYLLRISSRFPDIPHLWFLTVALTLPVFLEFIQFSVPHRRHSIVDVGMALLACGTAVIFRPGKMTKSENSNSIEDEKKFFTAAAIIFGIAAGFYFFVLPWLTSQKIHVLSNIGYYFHPYRWFMRRERLDSITFFLQTLAVFFPLGFFQQALFPEASFRKKLWTALALAAGWQIMLLFTHSHQAHLLQIPLVIAGTRTGMLWMNFYQELQKHLAYIVNLREPSRASSQ